MGSSPAPMGLRNTTPSPAPIAIEWLWSRCVPIQATSAACATSACVWSAQTASARVAAPPLNASWNSWSAAPTRSGHMENEMEWVSGNIFIRKSIMDKAGMVIPGHKHAFDHTTIVFKGSVHVRAKLPDNTIIERDFKAPTHFLVKKDVEHEITSLEDDSEFWCVYSHRDPQGEVVQ